MDVIDEEMERSGTTSAVYVRFDGTIDTDTLPPTPAVSREQGSSVQLLVVDPTSAYPYETTGGWIVFDEWGSSDGQVHTFSASDLTFMGHSQGGLNGALYLAMSDNVSGAVLSGAGGSPSRGSTR